jgi:hypothetical protein
MKGMKRREIIGAIRDELLKLNERIDRKIIRGESYRREAGRHLELRRQLARWCRRDWLARSLNFLTLF